MFIYMLVIFYYVIPISNIAFMLQLNITFLISRYLDKINCTAEKFRKHTQPCTRFEGILELEELFH